MSFAIALKSVVVLSLAWGIVASLRRLSPGAKHSVWLTAMVTLLVLPVIGLFNFSLSVESSAVSFAPNVFSGGDGLPRPDKPDLLASISLLMWAVGAALLLVRIVVGHWSVRVWLRAAQPAPELAKVSRHSPRVSIMKHPDLSSPLAVGLLRGTIVMPASSRDWPAEVFAAVMAHELQHIKRRDCLTQTIAQVARALFWFNPLVWVAEHALREQRELACDEAALAVGTKPSDYATWLMALQSAPSPAFAQVAAVAESSSFGQRIEHVLSIRRRWPVGATYVVATLFGCAALLVACGSVTQKEDSPSQEATRGAPDTPKHGRLDPNEIKSAIMKNRDAVRTCYERELVNDANLAGTVTVQFTISPHGRVTENSKVTSTMNNAAVETCIVAALSAIQFPQPEGGGEVTVHYPFMFKPRL